MFKDKLRYLFLILFINGTLLCNCGSDSESQFTQTKSEQLLNIDKNHSAIATFKKDFLFGIATAPAQVEDNLIDDWKRHAEPPYNFVSAYKNTENAEKRLNFWSRPDIEIKLASSLGIDIYRYGIDWQRLAPEDPEIYCSKTLPNVRCHGALQNMPAWRHYRDFIFNQVKASGMKTMLTLFHHSAPIWFVDSGGWLNKKNVQKFIDFSHAVIDQLKKDDISVDYWITLNEPNIYAIHSYVTKMWPGRAPNDRAFSMPNLLDYLHLGPLKGKYFHAIDNMIAAHKNIYRYIHHVFPNAQVSIAHNISKFAPSSRTDLISKISEPIIAQQAHQIHNSYILDQLAYSLDFLGINYYGREILSLSGLFLEPEADYMDSGRYIDPQGFYDMILWAYTRLKNRYSKNLPVFITENGISDATDSLRSAYFLEHLLALSAAENAGVPILGYIYWTLSDNFEWSDGYCPKFGLMGVDRSDPNLERRNLRPFSLQIFKDVVSHHSISTSQRDASWQRVLQARGQAQPMCRGGDGISSLDEPDYSIRTYKGNNWQFPYPASSL